MAPVELNDLDRRIWEEELAGFVPARVFDVHTHIYRWAFYTAPDKERGTYRQFVSEPFEEANWGVLRGKYIAFGYGWAYLSPTNHQLNLTHCDSRMTFTRYEQLRAMRQAAMRCGLSDAQASAMFFDTAADLVASTQVRLRMSTE